MSNLVTCITLVENKYITKKDDYLCKKDDSPSHQKSRFLIASSGVGLSSDI